MVEHCGLDAVDGVESEAVDVKIANPVKSVLDEEADNLVAVRPVEVESLGPKVSGTVK